MSNAPSALIPLVGLLIGLSAIVIGTATIKSTSEPEPKPEPEPSGARTYGGHHDLIARQRAWAGATPSQPAPRPADIAISEDDAFARWFTSCVILPNNPEPSDTIPLEHWVRSYIAYCDRNGLPRLSEAAALDLMTHYAEANNGIMDKGEFIGGQLVG